MDDQQSSARRFLPEKVPGCPSLYVLSAPKLKEAEERFAAWLWRTVPRIVYRLHGKFAYMKLEDAQDITGTIIAKCVSANQRHIFPSDTPRAIGYIKTSAYNACVDYYRKDDDPAKRFDEAAGSNSGEQSIEERIASALSQVDPGYSDFEILYDVSLCKTLTEQERTAITLHIMGYENKKIAKRMCISEGRVTHLKKVNTPSKLRVWFGSEQEPEGRL